MTDLTVVGKIKEMMWGRPEQMLPKAHSHHPGYSAGQQSLRRPHLQLTAFSWPGGRLLPGHVLGTHLRKSQTGEDLPRNDPETQPPLPGLLGDSPGLLCILPAPRPRSQRNWAPVAHRAEKAMAPHSSVLAWRIPGAGEPGGLPSTGSHRV